MITELELNNVSYTSLVALDDGLEGCKILKVELFDEILQQHVEVTKCYLKNLTPKQLAEVEEYVIKQARELQNEKPCEMTAFKQRSEF